MNRGPKDRRAGSRVATTTQPGNDDEAAAAKRKLEELFSGGKSAAPDNDGPRPVAQRRRAPSGKVFAAPRKSTGRSPTEYRMRLERLRIAREDKEIEEAANAFLAHHQLPDDADILFKVMRHPEERVCRDAMGQLSSLLMQGRLDGTMLLEDRLSELADRAKDDATISYIDGLRHQLAALRR